MRVLLIIVAFVTTTTTTTTTLAAAPYTAYPIYPPYCSTPTQMQQRRIPPLLLVKEGSYGASQIKHVTAIIRHGARTPWAGNLPCWSDYYDDAHPPWNCELQTTITPEVSATWFRKQYDALQSPEFNLTNELSGGTCQLGQLLAMGVVQELLNGEHLRDAYLGHEDSRMQLLFSQNNKNNNHNHNKPWESLYYRADDEQRTLMSGRVLLKGLFGNEVTSSLTIPMHTADYERDIVGENENVCPRLTQLRELFYLTDEFRQFNASVEAQQLRDFQRRQLRTDHDLELDCFMTTICTDRMLPDAINDYAGEDQTESMFLRLVNFYIRQYTSFAMANDAEYSKLAMGPLWAEIMDNVDRVIAENDDTYPRLALFSGHDTTIIGLLASLSKVYDGSWPPYASKLLLEIHEIDLDGRKDKSLYTTGYGFRLIYNGQVLTDKVEGCPKDAHICDVAILKRHLNFPLRDRDCSLLDIPTTASSSSSSSESGMAQVFDLFLSPSGFGVFVVVVLSSMAVGSVLMFVLLSKLQPQLIHRRSYGAASQENPE
ncbi:lysosomal acid phosphatase [Fistulifera solaris]|uniref:Lysosomal acid phosphatase n=1 Tax=Fistulifera solaris TaxID=1519565 RepID=A0A1Z5JKQ1_FISSO|nr:lysosomal acid phosphatase [Fistulifera solaris]|eukprot:GAX14564.1 lysosomal acid phosphatase [Fistulifera solaris]